MNKVVIGIIAFFGGYQVIKGTMTLGSLTAIMVYLSQIVHLHSSFAMFFQKIAMGLISCKRIDDILKQRPMVAKGGNKVIFKGGEIIFRDVAFGYVDKEPILNNATLDIRSGSHISIAGRSGCGKTTLLNLLLKLYEPSSGEILIDGHNIEDLDSSSLRGQIGVALQEPFLWNDTIENNIRYGKDDSLLEEVLYVAKICDVDDFVKLLPEGYQAIIGESGSKVSEGQKQKIAIARALIKRPKILILDEAFSSMDSASEEKILSNIKDNYREMTLISVSHRLSTVMSADSVCFLMGPGEIISGFHEDLLQNSKEYHDLFKAQLREPTKEALPQG